MVNSNLPIAVPMLAGLWLIPLTMLWPKTLRLSCKTQDPTRTGIAWLKTAFPLWLLTLVLSIISAGLWYRVEKVKPFIEELGSVNWTKDRYQKSTDAAGSLRFVALFSHHLSDIVLFITLSEIACGISCCKACSTGSVLASFATRLRYIVLTAAFVLFSLATSLMGIALWAVWGVLNDTENFWGVHRGLRHYNAAIDIIIWATSVPTLCLSIILWREGRNRWKVCQLSIILLIVTAVNFLRLILTAATQVYINCYDKYSDDMRPSAPALYWVVCPILDFSAMGVILGLLYVIATRKQQHGLWSEPRVSDASVEQQPSQARHAPGFPAGQAELTRTATCDSATTYVAAETTMIAPTIPTGSSQASAGAVFVPFCPYPPMPEGTSTISVSLPQSDGMPAPTMVLVPFQQGYFLYFQPQSQNSISIAETGQQPSQQPIADASKQEGVGDEKGETSSQN